MSFLYWVAGISLRVKMRRSVIRGVLRVKPLVFHNERSGLKSLVCPIRMLSVHLRLEVLHTAGGDPRANPELFKLIKYPLWPGEAMESPRKIWRVLGRGMCGFSSWTCNPCILTMNGVSGKGWMDKLNTEPTKNCDLMMASDDKLGFLVTS